MAPSMAVKRRLLSLSASPSTNFLAPAVSSTSRHHIPCRRVNTTARSVTTNSRFFDPIRDPSTLATHLLLSSSARKPLITLWTASWCPSCKTAAPIVRDMVERFGETSVTLSGSAKSFKKLPGGVMFAEVEIDSPTGGAEMGGRYGISSIPTLLAFSRQEARTQTRVTDVGLLKDRKYLWDWLEEEAKAESGNSTGGSGGGGGASQRGGSSGIFGGLFGGGSS